MKQTITLILFIITTVTFSQVNTQETFEGIIKYSYSYRNPTQKISVKENKERAGNERFFAIKGEKHISEYNGTSQMIVWYAGNDTIYFNVNDTRMLYYTPVKKFTDKIVSYRIRKNARRVNGIKCSVLILKTEKGKFKHFYNKEYKLSYEDFINYNEGFWNFRIKKTGSLALMTKYRRGKIVSKSKVVEIIRKKLNEEMFNVPKNLPIYPIPE